MQYRVRGCSQTRLPSSHGHVTSPTNEWMSTTSHVAGDCAGRPHVRSGCPSTRSSWRVRDPNVDALNNVRSVDGAQRLMADRVGGPEIT